MLSRNVKPSGKGMKRRKNVKALLTIFILMPVMVTVVWLNLPACVFNFDDDSVYSRARIMQERIALLEDKCRRHFNDPIDVVDARSPQTLGVEVVYLHSPTSESAVCIPHKVGSHSWGIFGRLLSEMHQPKPSWLDLDWKSRANQSVRVVVVRHPLERLLSVYRMIFENWCDPERFLAKQWNNVCREENFKPVQQTVSRNFKNIQRDFSTINFVLSLLQEHIGGHDRFIAKIWHKFHPGEKLTDPNSQLKFTFREFVRFLVNGTQEFQKDDEVLNYKGLSYHWAPFWQECSMCSNLTRPHLVMHMETLMEDLYFLLELLNLPLDTINLFPHTHKQKGGHSSQEILAKKYYSTLTKSQVQELYYRYQIDHELFGYSIEPYLSYAG